MLKGTIVMDIRFTGSDANGFQFDPNASPKPQKKRRQRKPIGSRGGRIAITTLVTLLVGAVFFYVELPAVNLHAEEFYGFVLLLCAVYCVCALLTSGFQGTGAKGYFTFVKKQCTASYQYNYSGTPVDFDALQAGDMVFFHNPKTSEIGHVGMYIGDGLFVHAASLKSGIKVSSLYSTYYSSVYAGAKRIIDQ